MALPLRTRSALAEIPFRMGQLRVSTEDEFILQPTIMDSPLNNIPLNYLSPAPSPDELVIRQRGRRRISLTWSPEKASSNGINGTPTKPTTTMTLRSSPRKRLHLSDHTPSTPEKKAANNSQTFSSPKTSSPSKWYPSTKRLRFEDRPIAQTNTSTPLPTLLKGLSNDQLMSIIQGMVRDQPQLEEKIRSELPTPDIRPYEEQLNIVKKNIFKSLPTSRLVKKTDSASFSRASTHLTAFKKAIVDQSRLLHDSQHWDALFDYSLMAWSYVKATPLWDNHSHNAIRRHCFKILSYHISASLKFGGHQLGEQRLNELFGRINLMSVDCEDILSSVSTVNRLVMLLQHQQLTKVNNTII